MRSRLLARSVVLSVLTLFFSATWVQRAEAQPRQARGDGAGRVPPTQQRQAVPGHQEVPRDPYVPRQPGQNETSPAGQSFRDGLLSVQVNVDANGENIVGDAANEPSLAVDPNDHNKMVIVWRQFDTIQSNFRQAGNAFTTDGGSSWTFPGVIEPGIFRSDPVVDVDSQGVFYYNSLTTDGNNNFTTQVFKSLDGGMTWGPGVEAFGGDKQWMVIDRTNGIGRDNIYAFWTRFFSICPAGHFTRSYDQGQSFVDCTNIPGTPQWGTLAIGPNGELYVCGDGFVVSRSSTVQDPNAPLQWDLQRNVNLDGSLQFGGGPNPGGLLGQTWIAVDRSNGPNDGNVYLLASVGRNSTPDPLDVMFARSTDGGNSWSAPLRVNDDPGTSAFQWFGTMSVAPNGRIDAIWNDTRNDPGGVMSEVFYSFSQDGGLTWSPNQSISEPFNPLVGHPNQNKIGDYCEMVSDDLGADLAYSATFNGEQDVYYVRITRGLRILFPNGLPDLMAPNEPLDLAVQIEEGSESLIAGSAMLHYRYDGGAFLMTPLAPLGGNLFTATFPPPTCADSPEFFFSAEGSASGVVTQPPNAPARFFSAGVGTRVTIVDMDFETAPGWFAENLAATSGDWERGVPVNDPNWAYDPISDSDGSGQCYVTQNQFGNTDVDNGAVRVTSGVFDLSMGNVAISYDYYLFLTNASGAVDQLTVEISSNDLAGPCVEIARHVTNGDLNWRTHVIDQTALNAAGVNMTTAMRLRFTANDANPQSIVEAGLDALKITTVTCGPAFRPGDLNCDGSVNGGDIDPFFLALGDPAAYAIAFPNCDAQLADMNGDGRVNGADIDPFFACLGGGVCP